MMRRPLRFCAALLLACYLGLGCSATGSEVRGQAILLSSKGRDEEASRLLEGYLARHPRALAERRLLIRIDASRGRLDLAETQVRALAAELGPSSPLPFIELGHALELAHRYDEALEQYDRASAVAPSDPIGPRTGGLRAARWGEAALAEPRLIESLRRDPKSAEAWHALGVVRAELGDGAGAELAYRSALEVAPHALENHLGLATLALVRGDASAALAEYDILIRARPTWADAYLGRAWALMQLGRRTEASRALEQGEKLGADRRSLRLQRQALYGVDSGAGPPAAPSHGTQ